MSNADQYKKLLLEMLAARVDGDGHSEDQIGWQLDRLWYRLSEDEKAEAETYVEEISRNHLDADGNVIVPLPLTTYL